MVNVDKGEPGPYRILEGTPGIRIFGKNIKRCSDLQLKHAIPVPGRQSAGSDCQFAIGNYFRLRTVLIEAMAVAGPHFSSIARILQKDDRKKERIMILIKRRDLLVGLTGLGLYSASGCSSEGSYAKNPDDLPEQAADTSQYDMQLRPHHILDGVTAHGRGVKIEPAARGHSGHIVSEAFALFVNPVAERVYRGEKKSLPRKMAVSC